MTRLCLIAASVAAAVACSSSKGAPDSGHPQCLTRSDCDAGFICSTGQFCAHCTSSGQCLLKELCDIKSTLCASRPGWGSQCQWNSQCSAGQWCSQGLCQDRANVQLCPNGTNAECPQGQRCNALNSVCEQNLGCLSNGDCDPGETCNTGSHTCSPTCSAVNQAQLCAPNQTCAQGLCVQCTSDAGCSAGLQCDPAGNCTSGAQCYTDRDCSVPLVCYAQTGQCVTKLPPCVSDENCAVGQRCQLGTGTCIPATCQPDRLEPNNSIATAFPSAAGNDTALTLCNGETDYFAFNLNRGDELGVDVNADPFAEQSFTTRIQDGAGHVLAYGHYVATYVAPAQAPYYAAINSANAYENYSVTFLLSRGTPCDNDLFEPNNTPAQATALNATTSVDAVICPQDLDYFRLDVPADAGIQASLDYNATAGQLELCLLAPPSAVDGGVWDGGLVQLACSEDSPPAVAAGAGQVGGGPAYLMVQGATQPVSNAYTLQVTP